MKGELHFRLLELLAEFRACQAVQKGTWSIPDLLVIPYTQLVTMQQNGGCVLGAFDAGYLAGFVAGFLGRQGSGPLYLYSQRMGVLPAYQGQGVGERLKWAQRDWAIGQGLELVVWTFDPLEPANARLNIAKLGGVARHFKRDIYGQHDSPLHRDLPTDRLVINWHLAGERVLACLAGSAEAASDAGDLLARLGPPANTVYWDDRGLPRSSLFDLARREPRLLLEVPADWQAVRQADIKLAADWRAQTRAAFEGWLAGGYAVTGYACGVLAGRRRNFYVLEREA